MKTTEPNKVLDNSIYDQTVTLTTGTGKKAVTKAVALKDIKIQDQFKKSYNVIDILKEGKDADLKKIQADTDCQYFAEHMVQLAMTCPSADAFQGLIKTATNSLRWGRVPGGTSKEEAKLWKPLPQTVKDYTSRIVRAWKQGIIPGKEYKVEQKNAAGKVVNIKQSATSPAIMLKIAGQEVKRKEALEQPKTQGAQAGVEVKPDGEQVTHIPPTSDKDNESAAWQRAKDDLKTMAACVSLDIVSLLSRTIELYDLADAKEKQVIINTIENLNNRLEKQVAKQAQAKAA